MIKESAKNTPEYKKYMRECEAVIEFYSQKVDERREEQKRLNLRGKDDGITLRLRKECNQKIKELKQKYHMLFE